MATGIEQGKAGKVLIHTWDYYGAGETPTVAWSLFSTPDTTCTPAYTGTATATVDCPGWTGITLEVECGTALDPSAGTWWLLVQDDTTGDILGTVVIQISTPHTA